MKGYRKNFIEIEYMSFLIKGDELMKLLSSSVFGRI